MPEELEEHAKTIAMCEKKREEWGEALAVRHRGATTSRLSRGGTKSKGTWKEGCLPRLLAKGCKKF